jgi:hypothetical protein
VKRRTISARSPIARRRPCATARSRRHAGVRHPRLGPGVLVLRVGDVEPEQLRARHAVAAQQQRGVGHDLGLDANLAQQLGTAWTPDGHVHGAAEQLGPALELLAIGVRLRTGELRVLDAGAGDHERAGLGLEGVLERPPPAGAPQHRAAADQHAVEQRAVADAPEQRERLGLAVERQQP